MGCILEFSANLLAGLPLSDLRSTACAARGKAKASRWPLWNTEAQEDRASF